MKFDRSACIEPMYSEIPFLDRFQAAKDDGFEYVEFWSWTDKNLDAVKVAAEKAGIGISGFNGDADYSLIDRLTRRSTSSSSRSRLQRHRRSVRRALLFTPMRWATAAL